MSTTAKRVIEETRERRPGDEPAPACDSHQAVCRRKLRGVDDQRDDPADRGIASDRERLPAERRQERRIPDERHDLAAPGQPKLPVAEGVERAAARARL
jgi:hypothetical protein